MDCVRPRKIENLGCECFLPTLMWFFVFLRLILLRLLISWLSMGACVFLVVHSGLFLNYRKASAMQVAFTFSSEEGQYMLQTAQETFCGKAQRHVSILKESWCPAVSQDH